MTSHPKLSLPLERSLAHTSFYVLGSLWLDAATRYGPIASRVPRGPFFEAELEEAGELKRAGFTLFAAVTLTNCVWLFAERDSFKLRA